MTNGRLGRKERSKSERIVFGSLVVIAGVLLVLRNAGFPFPSFLFTWPMIIIAVGLFSGIRDKFRNNSWWIITAVGCFFLAVREFPDLDLGDYFWPALIIGVGLMILFGKNSWVVDKRKPFDPAIDEPVEVNPEPSPSSSQNNAATGIAGEDVLDAAAIFGAVKKNIYSKNFRGGELVAVFGGAEVNLMHADFTGQMKIEIVNIFGGTTLYVPAHWQIRSEAAAIMGAIEDKRREPAGIQTDKVLIIEGFVLFGGIDIKSA